MQTLVRPTPVSATLRQLKESHGNGQLNADVVSICVSISKMCRLNLCAHVYYVVVVETVRMYSYAGRRRWLCRRK